MKNLGLYIFVFLFLIHGLPIATVYYPSVVFAIVVIVLFLILARYVYFRQWIAIAPLVVIPFLDMFIGASTDTIGFFQSVSGFLQVLIPVFLLYYIRKNDAHLGHYVLMFFLVSSLATTVTTYFGCVQIPGIIRQIVGGGSRTNEYYMIAQSLNIADFDFIYEMVMMLPVIICAIRYRDLFRKPLFILAWCSLFLLSICLMLLSAEFTTAIVSGFVTIVVLSVMNKHLDLKKLCVWGITVFAFFMVFRSMMVDVIAYFANNIESGDVSHRLSDLAASLSGEEISQGSDFESRQDHYKASVDAFVRHPLGTWNLMEMGGHSFVLDTLAKYGLLGIFLVYCYFKTIVKNYILPLKAYPYYGYAMVVFLISIIFSVVNPHVYTSFFCLYLPLIFAKFETSK